MESHIGITSKNARALLRPKKVECVVENKILSSFEDIDKKTRF
jgi:hypothetical protein